MITWIVDWGPECNGSRYALLQAESYGEAELVADEVGCTTNITVVPLILVGDDTPYLEIAAPAEVYGGKTLAETVAFSVEVLGDVMDSA